MSYEWYGILFLLIIVIAVIIIVIFINRGNTLNIIDQLPNYKIVDPSHNTYWGLINVNPNIFSTTINYEFSASTDLFWLPFTNVTTNADLNQWAIQTITPSSFNQLDTNTRMVKIINTGLFNANNNFGYLQVTPAPIRFVLANANANNATVFLYTSTGTNTFTLSLGDSHFTVNDHGYLVPTTGNPTEFKLVPV